MREYLAPFFAALFFGAAVFVGGSEYVKYSDSVEAAAESGAQGMPTYSEAKASQAIARFEATGEDVAIRWDDAPSPMDEEQLAALPFCERALDNLKVAPPLGYKKRCLTTKGEETLVTTALEESLDWVNVGPGEPMKRKIL